MPRGAPPQQKPAMEGALTLASAQAMQHMLFAYFIILQKITSSICVLE